MLGPFKLSFAHLFVNEGSKGAFILSRKGGTADFIGVSLDDLATTIMSFQNQAGYRFFWFSYADSAEKAKELANRWHHRYQPTDNATSPGDDADSPWRCEVEDCTTCTLAKMGVS